MKFFCNTCNEEHDGLPDIGADMPDNWYGIPQADRESRLDLTADTCVIDKIDYFIRGVLKIPLTDATPDAAKYFAFGVWVSLSPKNFRTYLRNFDSPDIGPFSGWLCTRVGYYPLTSINLKARAHFQSGNQRPLIELEPTGHPLSVDQRHGITLAKAWEIVHFYKKPSRRDMN